MARTGVLRVWEMGPAAIVPEEVEEEDECPGEQCRRYP